MRRPVPVNAVYHLVDVDCAWHWPLQSGYRRVSGAEMRGALRIYGTGHAGTIEEVVDVQGPQHNMPTLMHCCLLSPQSVSCIGHDVQLMITYPCGPHTFAQLDGTFVSQGTTSLTRDHPAAEHRTPTDCALPTPPHTDPSHTPASPPDPTLSTASTAVISSQATTHTAAVISTRRVRGRSG